MSWWKEAVFYHIYPKSFYDSNGDGIGDIGGIIQKLDYLNGTPDSLGIDAIWLSPVYPSPMVDGGYDVANYIDIDPMFGTLDTFSLLIKEAHKRDIKIIMDLVINHTSDKHPWFIESSSSRDNPKSDWYIWKNPEDQKPPNKWLSAFGGSAWKFNEDRNQYYLHSFAKEMPDLNWRNPEVKEEIFKSIRFWLDLGVDGFRLDVVNYYVKDIEFRNNPSYFYKSLRAYDCQVHIYDRNRPETHEILKDFRKLLDSYTDRVSIGEVFQPPPGSSKLPAAFYGEKSDELHLNFNFAFTYCKWNPIQFMEAIVAWEKSLKSSDWPTYFLSNHDFKRHISRHGNGNNAIPRAKIAAIMLLTLKGTPFLYYGEELGMLSERIPYKKIQDPAGKKYWPIFPGRDISRLPMCWENGLNAGFSTVEPWLPINQEYHKTNVKTEAKSRKSLLTFYKKLIAIRKKYDSLRIGSFEPIDLDSERIMAYLRKIDKKEQMLILLNFSDKKDKFILENRPIPLRNAQVIFSTHKREDSGINIAIIHLEPYEGTIVKLE
ncbi:MAG: alpha-glucosidase [Leptospiraceae bacterium]|nr:alpha-glucosidase [Leptospiraceae bacterium]